MQRLLKTVLLGLGILTSTVFISCSVTRNYNPDQKFSREELAEDYSLLRKMLETKHPSLYWYTPKDSMDHYFDNGKKQITDSMTEREFAWKVIAPLLSTIHCGHTSFLMSKGWQKFMKNRIIPTFPLSMKIWNDSMMVVNQRMSSGEIPRGSFIRSINGLMADDIIDTLFQYMSADGYAYNMNYVRLSTSFPYFFRNVFGISENYVINFTDSSGNDHSAELNWFIPKTDSTQSAIRKKKIKRKRTGPKPKKKEWYRNLEYDSGFALMTVNSFTKGQLNNFYRKSFRELRNNGTKNLVIDLRINGGGNINKSVALAKYIKTQPFKVADSAYSISKNFNPLSRNIQKSFLYNLGLIFFSKKQADGNYHFGYWERHLFKPKRKNHFNGKVYVLTNGLTFSAASMFCSIVKGEEHVTITGEETGGGWYGNSGIIIPNTVLPNTKLRVRLPFFRLVQSAHPKVKGSGVQPDWYIGPDWRDVLTGRDTKIEAIKNHILREGISLK